MDFQLSADKLVMFLLSLSLALWAAYVIWYVIKTKRRAKRDREEMAFYVEQQNLLNPVIINWRTTGRINMICGDPQIMLDVNREIEEADFILLIEEKRLVADISGAPTLQTQWRKASRRDARNTVKFYNERAYEPGAGEKLEQHVISVERVKQAIADGVKQIQAEDNELASRA